MAGGIVIMSPPQRLWKPVIYSKYHGTNTSAATAAATAAAASARCSPAVMLIVQVLCWCCCCCGFIFVSPALPAAAVALSPSLSHPHSNPLTTNMYSSSNSNTYSSNSSDTYSSNTLRMSECCAGIEDGAQREAALSKRHLLQVTDKFLCSPRRDLSCCSLFPSRLLSACGVPCRAASLPAVRRCGVHGGDGNSLNAECLRSGVSTAAAAFLRTPLHHNFPRCSTTCSSNSSNTIGSAPPSWCNDTPVHLSRSSARNTSHSNSNSVTKVPAVAIHEATKNQPSRGSKAEYIGTAGFFRCPADIVGGRGSSSLLVPRGAAVDPPLSHTAATAPGAQSAKPLCATAAASSSATADDKIFSNFAAQSVALFPGQGAQCLGMGVEAARNCKAAKELFTTASEVVGRDLLLLCSEGPEPELHQTAWAQPALLTASMAAVARWRDQQQQQEAEKRTGTETHCNNEPTACAGLSLGEYTALCFADSLSFADAVRLTRLRGLSMQQAAEKYGGGMAAVLGLPREALEQLCAIVRDEIDAERASHTAAAASSRTDAPTGIAAGGDAAAPVNTSDKQQSQQSQRESMRGSTKRNCVLVVANYLCPGNYTVSGEKEALARLEELALGRRNISPASLTKLESHPQAAGESSTTVMLLQQRAKRFLPLRVSGAFHSALMGEAAAALQQALETTPLRPPRIPVIFNVDAQVHSDPTVIKEKLMLQLTSPVLMEDSLRVLLARGMRQGFEFGPGNVVSNLVKKISSEGVDLQQIP